MRLLDLFSGIGGFSLAAQWVWGDDLEIVSFVEIDPYCQKVLRKHWPEVPIIEDIKKVEWVVADTEGMGRRNGSTENQRETSREINSSCDKISIPEIDLLTGGFPCQPFSCAGKRAGAEDDRFLWPEMLRAIHEVKPRWVVAENVSGILSLDEGLVFEGVCTDLEAEEYEVIPLVIPACAVGAPHRRDRVWIVAHTRCLRQTEYEQQSAGFEQSDCHAPDNVGNTEGTGQQSSPIRPWEVKHGGTGTGIHWYEVATRFCRVDDGVSRRVDRLKSLGNAIVPQVAEQIFRAIKEIEE